MNYKNYIATTILKESYETIAKELFAEWNALYNNICSYEDRDIFIEDFCKHLYDAKLETISEYPNKIMTDYENGQKIGFFMGYFESTMTMHWKSIYHLKHQANYDKILWLQSLTLAMEYIPKHQSKIKQIYEYLSKQSQKSKNIFNRSNMSLKDLLHKQETKLDDKSSNNNMLYLMTVLLEKFDLKSAHYS